MPDLFGDAALGAADHLGRIGLRRAGIPALRHEQPPVDDDSLTFARALKDKGVPVPEIAKKLTIKTGKNAGKNPSVASLYRALAEAEQAETPAVPEIIAPRRPARVDLTGPGSATDPELMERLQRQVLGGAADDVLDTLVEQTEDQANNVVAALLAQAPREEEDV
ncbi:hypothetical protein ACH4YO_31785 [Streptomyces noursei]|uniref:hypothetical protein n=1 Tax=Streptomyces noursei TaxID=1971 RepID=UPI0033E11438